ncbi:hypothetical protein [Mesomycoplasma molare]|uniref:Uncharacterized protein n=1 Tax=Mesomycoplasma molare TaxID=171288 RepID=A0ABY5TYB6_9BACT|nr:hypothetical protein [Mesomycoplasma molare]UWD34029.1 hypothetical protein NX772_02900 [Mesomycoplasma molare]
MKKIEIILEQMHEYYDLKYYKEKRESGEIAWKEASKKLQQVWARMIKNSNEASEQKDKEKFRDILNTHGQILREWNPATIKVAINLIENQQLKTPEQVTKFLQEIEANRLKTEQEQAQE